MPWFNVDDGFCSHPKVLATSLSARGLWVTAGSWCSSHLTDGVVPSHVLASLGGTPTLAEELVTAGLWKKRRGGYVFHDWKQCNKTKKEVVDIRQKRADAGRKGGLSSGNTRSKPQANASARASPVVEPQSLSSYRAKSAGRSANGAAPTRRNPKPERPPWCGECDEHTRQRENPQNGLPMRCPRCHPLAERTRS